MGKHDELIQFDKESHEYYLFGVHIPSVTQVLKKAGYSGNHYIDPIYAKRGTFVHLLTEEIDKGNAVDWELVPPEWIPFITAYQLFRADEDFQVEKSEYLIFSPEYLYAGTADREYSGGIQGDIKTGNYAGWHEMQLSGYMHASGCTKGLDLYLLNSGEYKVRWMKDAVLARDAFLTACNAYWFDGRKRDRVKLLKLIAEYEHDTKEEKALPFESIEERR